MRRENYTPKNLVYPGITALLIIWWAIFNASDLAIQEQDYVMDSFILACCFMMLVSSPRHLRYRDMPNNVVIIVCLKLIYFNDNEKGMNNIVEPELVDGRAFAQEVGQYLMAIPLVLCIFLENKIARHYSLGTFHKL